MALLPGLDCCVSPLHTAYLALTAIVALQTKASVDGHFNIVKERRKLTTNKIAASVFRLLDKSLDTRLSHEEFLTAIGPNAEVSGREGISSYPRKYD